MKAGLRGPVVCDVAGLSLTDEDAARLRRPAAGMVILFSRNYESPAQLRSLCDEIRSAAPGVLIAVDHEGGRVQRFREGFTAVPAMGTIGALRERFEGEAEQCAAAAGWILAAELRACGVDFTFAPVLDLDWGRSGVIGRRSFGRDPVRVARLARALIGGLSAAGMPACGKHFPGHGWAQADSHLALPEDERPLDAMQADLEPYRQLALVLPSVMTAHVRYCGADGETATFSETMLQDVLRRRLGYPGFVFSDDLTMQGARTGESVAVRARRAMAAGCDAVLVCNDPETADELIDSLADWRPSAGFVRRSQRLVPRAPYHQSMEELRRDPLWSRARADLEGAACGLESAQEA